MHNLAEAGVARPVIELGALTSGAERLTPDARRTSLCDLTGTGSQDTAIAVEAYRRIKQAGAGTTIGR